MGTTVTTTSYHLYIGNVFTSPQKTSSRFSNRVRDSSGKPTVTTERKERGLAAKSPTLSKTTRVAGSTATLVVLDKGTPSKKN
jgi:hypothetical protein